MHATFATLLFGFVASIAAAPDPRRTYDVHNGPAPFSDKRSLRLSRRDTCAAPADEVTTASKATPFLPLTEGELESVVAWISDPARGLNLTNTSSPSLALTDNYIWHVELLKPNKTDVLAYLDGNVTKVPRYARVTINEGGKKTPLVTDYFVGPLPISCKTKVAPLDYFYNGANGPSVLFNGRFNDAPQSKAIEALVAKTMSGIADITQDLIELQYFGRGDNRSTASYFVQNPSSTDGTTGVIWTPWRRNGLAPYDQPSDLYVSFDITGTDTSLWHLRMILYNLVVYHSAEEFRAAWAAGSITKTPPPSIDDSFLKKDRQGAPRDLENRLAPAVLSLEGKRFKVDRANQYVEYLGWSFYTRFDRDVGIQFYDIKFKGERILYELSLQDAGAQYAGHNPFQTGTAYIDRFYGIGAQVTRPIPGYDCPYHATYFNFTYTDGLGSVTLPSAICIFETDIGTPVTRHTDQTYEQSTKGSKLVVRQIATVGNYDYLWDYAFYVDGTIGIDAHASGYVQANYYRPDDHGLWGPRIQQTIAGTLHTHVMNFKADFDLVDSKNTLLRTDIIVENITQPWFPERGTFEQMRYNITEIATEDDGILPVPANGQSMYAVINRDHLNQWGEPRGYRIIPGLSIVHLASQLNPFFLKSGQVFKQAFAVTRQHDTEPASSAALNQNVPEAPLVEFWKFLDGESLVQEDLVAWVNLGMHHYTRAEDIPNTLMSEAHSSVLFAPQNWGNTELTKDLQNAVIFNAGTVNAAGQVVPDTNGVSPPACLALAPEDELLGVF